MDMQDNEFDGLFRNKLDGFESEPSERVWTGVGASLDGKKRPVVLWLSIAASIVVLVTAGILFIPKAHKTDHNDRGLVKSPVKHPVAKPEAQAEQVAVAPVAVKKTDLVKPEQQGINIERHKKQVIVAPLPEKPTETLVKNETAKPVEQPEMIALVPAPKDAQVKTTAVVPDKDVQLVTKPDINPEIVTNAAKPALVATAQSQAKPATPAVKKHGIRNFGDIVNLVVAKVDKRKDKALQFTDDEDGDGSSLTAVNIGPVKLAKDR